MPLRKNETIRSSVGFHNKEIPNADRMDNTYRRTPIIQSYDSRDQKFTNNH